MNKTLHIGGLHHKGTTSTKPVFEKITKYKGRMSRYVDIQHLCLMTLACTMTIVDKSIIFFNDVNKTRTSVELLAKLSTLRAIKK